MLQCVTGGVLQCLSFVTAFTLECVLYSFYATVCYSVLLLALADLLCRPNSTDGLSAQTNGDTETLITTMMKIKIVIIIITPLAKLSPSMTGLR